MQYLSPQGHPPLKFPQLIAWRWAATITAYLFLSLAYSFVSMAFQINFFGTNPVTSETQVTMVEYGTCCELTRLSPEASQADSKQAIPLRTATALSLFTGCSTTSV